MYNRYVVQRDGTVSRQQLPEALPDSPPKSAAEAPSTAFLRGLFPAGLDTGDLLVVAMLLLMSGQEDRNHAMLTLVLYLVL